MKLAVTGASGSLGQALVRAGVAAGHDVTALVRSRKAKFPSRVTVREADIVSGLALRDAFAGCDAIVDGFNVRSTQGLVQGTRNILEAAGDVDVKHFVGISIIGCDKVGIPYHRSKVKQEEVIERTTMPWSLVRATPFFDLLDKMFSFSVLGMHFVPRDMLTQPVSVDEVATYLVAIAADRPMGRAPDFAGPEIMTMNEAFETWCHARGVRAGVIPIPLPGKMGRAARDGALTNPERAVGKETFSHWLGRLRQPTTRPVHAT
ncbi:MAG: NAD(P)H-binding protein [Polyangiaceae bacterium]|nr:NAD(P)H-binding protein [Polyangiaceae bacterium]